MKVDNDSSSKQLAKSFSKNNCIFTYSASLAIELALLAIGVNTKDKVILPNNVCYRVLLSVIRLGGLPILVKPSNSLFLTREEIVILCKKFTPKCIIIVHQFGICINLKSIKRDLPQNTFIIEDASQVYDINMPKYGVGKYSDYVVTSFGSTKPLSLGLGGAIIYNSPQKINNILDSYNKESRYAKDMIYPYLIPNTFNININDLIKIAIKRVNAQRMFVKLLIPELELLSINFFKPKNYELACWHRFPVWTQSNTSYNKLVKYLDSKEIKYQVPFKTDLEGLPILKNKPFKFVNLSNNFPKLLLIQTNIN